MESDVNPKNIRRAFYGHASVQDLPTPRPKSAFPSSSTLTHALIAAGVTRLVLMIGSQCADAAG